MSQSDTTSIISTASGLFGGVGKALYTQQILANVTWQGIQDVAIYAAISALVGYGVKVLIDYLKKGCRK